MQLKQGIDYFIGPAFHRDADTLFKVRLLVGILFSFLFSVIGFAPVFVVIPNLPSVAIWSYLISAVPLTSCWLVLLHYLKQGRRYQLCAHVCNMPVGAMNCSLEHSLMVWSRGSEKDVVC